MSIPARIDELEKKFAESPRRFFAPLANEYRKAGDFAKAIELCRTSLEQQPNHMSGQVVLGQALYDSGSHDEARAAFEAALALDPENLIALRHLGDMARAAESLEEARGFFDRVLDVDPRNHEVALIVREINESLANAGGTAILQPRAEVADEESITDLTFISVPEDADDDDVGEIEEISAGATGDVGDAASDEVRAGEKGDGGEGEVLSASAGEKSAVVEDLSHPSSDLPDVVADLGTSATTFEGAWRADLPTEDLLEPDDRESGTDATAEVHASADPGATVGEAVAADAGRNGSVDDGSVEDDFWSEEVEVDSGAAEGEFGGSAAMAAGAQPSSDAEPAAKAVDESEAADEESAGESSDVDAAGSAFVDGFAPTSLAAAMREEVAQVDDAEVTSMEAEEGPVASPTLSAPVVEEVVWASAVSVEEELRKSAEASLENVAAGEDASLTSPDSADEVAGASESGDVPGLLDELIDDGGLESDALAAAIHGELASDSHSTSGKGDQNDGSAESPDSASEQDVVDLGSVSDDSLEWEITQLSGEDSAEHERGGGEAEWLRDFTIAEDGAPMEPASDAEFDVPLDPEPAEASELSLSTMELLDNESGSTAGPAVFITETMARLYAQQGYREMAVAIYRQLLERDPANSAIAEQIRVLEGAGRSDSGSHGTGRRGAAGTPEQLASAYFGALCRAELSPRRASQSVGAQGSTGSAEGGSEAREANGELSLSSVFRSDSGRASAAARAPGFTFEQFFADRNAVAERDPRPARQRRSEDAEEISQFNAWLEGLKRT